MAPRSSRTLDGPAKVVFSVSVPTVPISRINAYAQRGFMVYFKPVDKKMGSILHTHTHECYDCYLSTQDLFLTLT